MNVNPSKVVEYRGARRTPKTSKYSRNSRGKKSSVRAVSVCRSRMLDVAYTSAGYMQVRFYTGIRSLAFPNNSFILLINMSSLINFRNLHTHRRHPLFSGEILSKTYSAGVLAGTGRGGDQSIEDITRSKPCFPFHFLSLPSSKSLFCHHISFKPH